MRAGPCRVKSPITFCANEQTGQSTPSTVRDRLAGSGSRGGAMTWYAWLTVFFVVLALAGCAQGVTGQS